MGCVPPYEADQPVAIDLNSNSPCPRRCEVPKNGAPRHRFGGPLDHSAVLSTGRHLETRIRQNRRQIRLTPRQALLGFQSWNIISVNLVLANKKKKAKKAMKKKARKAAKKRVVKRKPAPAPAPAPEPAPVPEAPASVPSQGTSSSSSSTGTW